MGKQPLGNTKTFYVPPAQFDGDIATLTADEHHHLRNVLRIRTGETIRLMNGEGTSYLARVLDTKMEGATQAQILSAEFHAPRLPSLTLFQGVPKHDKMELILQKTTELGVTRIVPMHAERSLQKPSQNRCERWQRVIISATKQCGRAWLPELSPPQKFEACLAQVKQFALSLLCCENERERHIKTVLRHHEGQGQDAASIAIFIGPEGGFSAEEVNAAAENGCIPVTLGPNILRTETAAIASVAVVYYQMHII